MMILAGVIFIILGVFLFKVGVQYKDPGGTKISNINLAGAALLLIIIGLAFFFSKKSFCEIFYLLCDS
jgi:hypothetical protein